MFQRFSCADRMLCTNDGNFFWRCSGQADGTRFAVARKSLQPLTYPWCLLITFIYLVCSLSFELFYKKTLLHCYKSQLKVYTSFVDCASSVTWAASFHWGTLMKTVCSCLAQIRRGAEKWYQFRWVWGSPNPRRQGFLPQIRRNAMSGFMHC